jgi:hypothetical protein
MKDKNTHGIFDDCWEVPCPKGSSCTGRFIHTDFFAIRPNVLSLKAVEEAYRKHRADAERMATDQKNFLTASSKQFSADRCLCSSWTVGFVPFSQHLVQFQDYGVQISEDAEAGGVSLSLHALIDKEGRWGAMQKKALNVCRTSVVSVQKSTEAMLDVLHTVED